jgi:Zinc knuckle/Retrotransposon gag protein
MDIDARFADLETKHLETRGVILQLSDTLEQFMAQMQAALPPPIAPIDPGPPAPARSPSPIHLTPAAPILTPISTPKRNRLKPGLPPDFDGDRKGGRAFLNSCQLYMSLCASDFEDDAAKIKWTLSYLKHGRAALFADRMLRFEARNHSPMYDTWPGFRNAFVEAFCPENEAMDARMRLESSSYFQGRRSVDAYIDEFQDLVDLSGYTDKLTIVVKFRRGLSQTIQDKIAESGNDCPDHDDPKGWYRVARLFDRNRLANDAFNSSMKGRATTQAPFTPRQTVSRPPFIPFTTHAPIAPSKPPPAPALPPGVPMDVDAQRAKKLASTCHRCGAVGHFARDCPKRYDIRHMTMDEREGLLQDLLASRDAAVHEEAPKDEVSEATEEGEGFSPNDG